MRSSQTLPPTRFGVKLDQNLSSRTPCMPVHLVSRPCMGGHLYTVNPAVHTSQGAGQLDLWYPA